MPGSCSKKADPNVSYCFEQYRSLNCDKDAVEKSVSERKVCDNLEKCLKDPKGYHQEQINLEWEEVFAEITWYFLFFKEKSWIMVVFALIYLYLKKTLL